MSYINIGEIIQMGNEAHADGIKEGWALAIEAAAKVAESEPRVWETDAPDPQHRIAAKIRALRPPLDNPPPSVLR